MKSLYIVLAAILTLQVATSQTLPTNTEFYKNKGIEAKLEDFNGSKYLNDNFAPSVVEDRLTQKKTDKYLRYDALNDFFEMRDTKEASKPAFLKKEIGLDVVYDGKPFVYMLYFDESGQQQYGYLHRLGTLGNKVVYAKYGKTLRMPEKAKTTLENDRKGRISDEKYFLVENRGSVSPIDIDRKSVVDFYEKNQQAAIKNYIKENKLKFKEVDDVIQLSQFMN
ncbi:hypothetical protein EAX61_08415 [Dokdonia sinensis]|uniref:GLPGLI family protein n=2 Tax=Dokdonia sinensis TaxID=2479847 RepID=A0A3M0G4P0_9FLAO|nr:hypothetical protein EAX61_08415 [Dokdonia sinensis]